MKIWTREWARSPPASEQHDAMRGTLLREIERWISQIVTREIGERDIWTLTPEAACLLPEVDPRAQHLGHGRIQVRALVKGRERGYWYVSEQVAAVISDELTRRGHPRAGEWQRAWTEARRNDPAHGGVRQA